MGEISRKTRQNIFDGMSMDGVSWAGNLDEPGFLNRIFDLKAVPSTDARYADAAGDIWQHRVNNYDWDDDWIYRDARFNLLGCPDDTFLSFLVQVVHPVVRPDNAQSAALVSRFNEQLRPEGWELASEGSIAGRSYISPSRLAWQAVGHLLEQSRWLMPWMHPGCDKK